MGCGCGKSSGGSRAPRPSRQRKRVPKGDSTKPPKRQINDASGTVKRRIEKIKERIRKNREEDST
ncbi:MAG: hypothetical protein CMF69_00380 [Magnetovibrio sp.]|nr:hypothetical protein [Magnetovibrio sp.]